ncbi:MAG: Ig-like domain-containing protein [Saprospiraceae bacterium]|nr:Ig-like domain-containing protein [Saprospiraceae bacterium]
MTANCLLPPCKGSNCRTVLLLLALAALCGCANIVPIEGGPKDLDPPQLDSLRSTRNYQTRFQKQDIVLAFNEWVELRDVFTQVIISPPLAKRPEIVRRKKTIQVLFDKDEVLRDSATYVINFGQAIRDLTEGNVAPIVFVFSTGDYIDSLSVEGTIVDAWTEKPMDKTLFMLYENTADSVVRTERPFYFGLTNKDGKFKVSNVKSGRFKAVALNDLNLNYTFDGESEQIGFLDSLLTLSGEVDSSAVRQLAVGSQAQGDSLGLDSLRNDSLRNDSLQVDSLSKPPALRPAKPPTPVVNLRLFAQEKPLFLRSKEASKYGRVTLGFNQPPAQAKISFDSAGQVVFLENEKDSVRLWYHHPVQDTTWRIFLQRDTSVDTVLVKSGLRANFLTSAKLTTATKLTGQPVKLAPEQPLSIQFNQPLGSINTANIRLLEDTSQTVVQPRLRIDSLARRNFLVEYSWKEGVPYQLQLLPGALTDIYGLSNADTILQKANAALRKDFGSLTLKAVGLDSVKAYVVQLLDKPDSPPLRVWTVASMPNFEVKLPLMPPGAYTVELIEDTDRNGRWTTGNYDLHRQPERFVRRKLEELRANWELDAEVRF